MYSFGHWGKVFGPTHNNKNGLKLVTTLIKKPVIFDFYQLFTNYQNSTIPI